MEAFTPVMMVDVVSTVVMPKGNDSEILLQIVSLFHLYTNYQLGFQTAETKMVILHFNNGSLIMGRHLKNKLK